MHDYLRTLAVQQLESLSDDSLLVVIHPNYIQQHTILSQLYDEISLYICFNGNNLSYDALKAQYETATATQGNGTRKTIILDECDRGSDDGLAQLLAELREAMPSTRIVMMSRKVPTYITDNADIRQATEFIPKDENRMLWDYATLEKDAALLEVRSFGEGHVVLNGRIVDNWDGVLPRSLFFYLVDRGMTTRNEIFETFWPNLTTREATNVFHVTKRKISEVLGIDLTTYWSGFYRISPDIQLSYDVILFTEMFQNSAIAEKAEALNLLETAVSLYRGPFLHNMTMKWAMQRREELNMDFSDALSNLADFKAEDGHIQNALGLYLRASVMSPHREDLTANIMQIYRQLDMHSDAIAVFDQLSATMKAKLSLTPGTPLQELAHTIRQEMSQAVV